MRRVLASVLGSILVAGMVGLGPASVARAPGFHARVGTSLSAVAVAPDGSVYAVGERHAGGTTEALLVKFRPNGSVAWRHTWLPGPEAATGASAVAVAPDGTVSWAGYARRHCEGSGWFLESLTPTGRLLRHWITPEWRCGVAESIADMATSGDRIVVSGTSYGCCGDPYLDGWVKGFGRYGGPRWTAPFEPPVATPETWFDRASGLTMGVLGNIYVGGWAATAEIPDDASPTPGTAVIEKMTSGGTVLWSRRIDEARMPGRTDVAVSVRGDRLMVAAGIRGRGVEWYLRGRHGPSDGWLGRFTVDGRLVWSHRWDKGVPHAAAPAHVAIGAAGDTWVVGTRRDPWDRGLDVSVRRYGPTGALLSKRSIDAGHRKAWGTGVAVGGGGAYLTGFVGAGSYGARGGRLWWFAA